MSTSPIHIVGAGITGLVLSRCLLKRGIPFHLYDRSPTPAHNNYAITLHASTYCALCKELDIEESLFQQRVGISTSSEAKETARNEENELRVHRGALEALLHEPLNIQTNHQLSHISLSLSTPNPTSPSPPSKTLHFTTAPSLQTPALLIAADGMHSGGRTSLLPSHPPTILPYVAFTSRRHLPGPISNTLYAPAFTTSPTPTLLTHHIATARLTISLTSLPASATTISWTYSRPARSPPRPLSRQSSSSSWTRCTTRCRSRFGMFLPAARSVGSGFCIG
ncbi:hypothetical protein BU16DRAFT_585959 [Lophium mytilinum]|uniref:FAD-binding domain-containing protein n=1 Tax=Lophium mytilinum TaxID=390894 RepID=A0A6A6QCF6_9PEZI|nr:hypothetical protein BU16DRAFT_585959 [Lophium mytilinum]